MTVIAYKDGVLAADGLTNACGHIVGRSSPKIGKRGQILWSADGDVSWGWTFRSWCRNGFEGYCPKPPDEQTGGIVYLPDGDLLVFNDRGTERRVGLPFYAAGSGCDYAMGAMAMGANPIQAVQVAIEWHALCGGEITVLRR